MALDRAPSTPQANRRFVDNGGVPTMPSHTVLEEMWRQIVAGFVIVPCIASGTANAIVLTPRLHKEGAANLGDGMAWSFTAALTSAGAVTAVIQPPDAAAGAFPVVKVYVDGGATQAGAGDVVAASKYFVIYDPALDSAAGGLALFASAQSAAGAAAAVLPFIYPVGCIYISTNSTNPATSLGFGTWVAYGAGQVPVGFAAGDPDFGTDGQTGGEKTHTLTAGESAALAYTSTLTSITGTVPGRDSGAAGTGGALRTANTGVSDPLPLTVSASTITTTDNAGGGAHNNLQPYVVVRMWQRTA